MSIDPAEYAGLREIADRLPGIGQAMGIPIHLPVDPRTGTGIVPDEPGYTSRTEFAFGNTVTVGPWPLDTGVLRAYT
ncbi:hypothetical protein [Kitasatospora indigofera]|uniref:hypothetical protein n=1 Tax=Kitasatospora indigofera TaxID=67307 RepID=UPI0033AC7053